ncbi:MAG: PIN domain-containing protein [Xanthomonadales bacterium]|nr:PIN domain-containing protein [Xanthomonadales bacterium]
MRAFVDSNLWIYRLDPREPVKAKRLGRWLRDLESHSQIVISTQVMIEVRSVLTRKFVPALPADAVGEVLAAMAAFEVVNTDATLVQDAHVLTSRLQLSWFDALIVEAAVRSGCERLYSEDLQHGRTIDGLTILNPFRDHP